MSINKKRYDLLLARATEVFGNEKHAEEWMHRELLALGMRRPVDILDNDKDFDRIMDILGRIEHGVFS